MSIIKPPLDNRNYESFLLKNKLQVLLINNKDLNMSSVSMNVGVGSYMDSISGIAHFLEHMLFMGTKKYPSENKFMNFISENGGYSNAFTGSERTNYHYEIKNKSLKKSLDIFAQFFIHPLFNKDSVEREINAVDSEHQKNINNDMRRLIRVIRTISNPKYPFHNFSTGCKETLEIENIRKHLIDFYDKFYSSNIMKLVILGNFKIDNMKKYIIKLFSKIKNKNVYITKYKNTPFLQNEKKNSDYNNLLEIVPIKNINDIGIIWYSPFTKKSLITKEIEYLTHILGHEGENSLYSILYENGFINFINAGIMDNDICYNYIYININATEKGFKNRNLIVNIIYYFLENIIFKKINEDIYNDIKKMCDISFKFSSLMNSIDYIIYLTNNMVYYDTKNIIYGDYKMNKFKDSIKKDIMNLGNYIKKENSIIIFSSKFFENKTNKIEKWYKVKYNHFKSKKLSFNKNNLNKFVKSLNLPKKNIFIPNIKKLKIIKDKKSYSKPKMLSRKYLWHKFDIKYKTPTILTNISINTPDISSNIDNYLKCKIFIKSFFYFFRKHNYNSSLADCEYDIHLNMNNIEISFKGYSSRFYDYVDFVTYYLSFFKPKKKMIDFTIKNIIKDLENSKLNEPYLNIDNYLNEICLNKFFNIQEKLDSIKKINYKDIQNIFKNIIKEKFIKIYIHGNINKENSIKLYDLICKRLFKNNCSNYKIPEISDFKNIKKNINILDYNIKPANKNENNSCTLVSYFIDYIKPGITINWEKNIILLFIVNNILSEPFFSELRSKQQLGYIVRCFLKKMGSIKYQFYTISFLVQSSKKKSKYLKDKIMNFIENDAKNIILNITENDFLKHIDSIKSNLLDKPDNIYEDYEKQLSQIKSSNYMFNKNKLLIKYLKKIKISDLHDFFNKYIVNNKKIITLLIDP